MKIIVGADLVPTESNFNEFVQGDIDKLIDENLENILNNADFRVFNLEVPLTDEAEPIVKYGPNLIAPIATIKGVKKLGVDFLNLSNNHIMDQGKSGLESTINSLKKAGIEYAGAGENLKEAAKPYIVQLGDAKIGIYSCAEHEFSIATADNAGANPFDYLESFDHVARLKDIADYVIVMYHGGKEHYRYPSPNLQKICRKFCEKGANLVVCQHSHCIGCEEIYNDSIIVYGQGNFLFDHSKSDFWKTSLLVSIDTETQKVEYIPLCKNGKGVRLAGEKEGKAILDEFKKRSEEIKSKGFIENEYKKFAGEMRNLYFVRIDSMGVVFRILNKLCRHKLKYRISQKRALAIRNYVECEAHRELFLKGISDD